MSHNEDVPAEDECKQVKIYRGRNFKVKMVDIIKDKVINVKYISLV